jgi:nitrous oxidase accessory protein
VARGVTWNADGRGNYWSDYRGYDEDGDGIGDRPYRLERSFTDAFESDEDLALFRYSLAHNAIEAAANMFPVYSYEPVIEDASPLMAPPGGLALDAGASFNRPLLFAAGGLSLAACILFLVIAWPSRTVGRRRLFLELDSKKGQVRWT